MRTVNTLASMIFAGMALAPAPTFAITAEELVGRNLDARGGRASIEAIRSLQSEGEMVYDNNTKLDFKLIARGGLAVRSESTMQGLTAVQAYDGKDGWAINPFQGRRDPERMSADELKSMRELADFNGPLVDYKADGKRLEYLGLEDVDGTLAHKLRLTDKAGDEQLVYLDPDYFLEIRTISRRTVRGNEQEVETDIGDYEKVAGTYFPHSFAIGRKGADDKPQKITLARIVANVEVDDTHFAFPEGAPKSPPAAKDPAESRTEPPPVPAQRAKDPIEMEQPGVESLGSAGGATP